MRTLPVVGLLVASASVLAILYPTESKPAPSNPGHAADAPKQAQLLPNVARKRAPMTEREAKVVAAWREAAVDLGFRFTSPYIATSKDGQQFEALGLIHEFGGVIGTLISAELEAGFYPPVGDGYGVSYLAGYARYDRESWIEMLCDWGFRGEPSRTPSWYSPGPHCRKQ